MYPDGELTRLALHKAALRYRIGRRRAECARLAAAALRPLTWVDRVHGWWRKFRPLAAVAAVPAALLAQRFLFPRLRPLQRIWRWGPAMAGAARLLWSLRRPART